MAQILTRYSMFSAGERIGVAVSGGADSVVLLHLLRRVAQTRPPFMAQFLVLHVNHGLRGAESDAEEEFVRQLAASLAVDVVVANGAPDIALAGNLEQEARLVRRNFFLRCRKQYGLHKVALGHNRGDQAETVLFRLLRGSGITGLAGMQPVTADGLIRPLLETGRTEIREWARSEGIYWREDSSNEDRRFRRNRLRHETLPALTEAYNPNLEAVLAGTAELAQTEEDYWNRQIEPMYRAITKRTSLGSFCKIETIGRLHPAIQRRLIRHVVANVKGDLRGVNSEHIDAILGLCRSERGHNRVLIPGVDALRSFGELLCTEPGKLAARTRQYCLRIEIGEKCDLPFDGGTVCVNWVKSPIKICGNFKEDQDPKQEVVDLDWDILAQAGRPETLAVRNWEPGDEILRPRHKTAEKIKSLFQEDRVLLWERKHWPVLEIGNEIVWTKRFGSAAKFIASEKSGQIVRLVYGAATPPVGA